MRKFPEKTLAAPERHSKLTPVAAVGCCLVRVQETEPAATVIFVFVSVVIVPWENAIPKKIKKQKTDLTFVIELAPFLCYLSASVAQ